MTDAVDDCWACRSVAAWRQKRGRVGPVGWNLIHALVVRGRQIDGWEWTQLVQGPQSARVLRCTGKPQRVYGALDAVAQTLGVPSPQRCPPDGASTDLGAGPTHEQGFW